jgi:hypothetical protein
MIEYIKHRLNKINGTEDLQELKRIVSSLYTELEARGYKHEEVYVLINQACCDKIRALKAKLDGVVAAINEMNCGTCYFADEGTCIYAGEVSTTYVCAKWRKR